MNKTKSHAKFSESNLTNLTKKKGERGKKKKAGKKEKEEAFDDSTPF